MRGTPYSPALRCPLSTVPILKIEYKMPNHIEQTTFLLLVFSVGAAALWFVRMAIAFWRTRLVPHCWYCGASKVIEARTFRAMDYLSLLSFMVPLRCQGCLTRFYGVRGCVPAAKAIVLRQPVTAMAREEQAPQVRFRSKLRIPSFSKAKTAPATFAS